MGFSNPIVAGEELIRPSIKSPNFVSGEEGLGVGWRISQDGTAEFNDANIRGEITGASGAFSTLSSDTFYYNGDELTTLLDRAPRGIVGWGSHTTTPPATTTKAGIMELEVTTEPGRTYEISTNVIFPTLATGQVECEIRYTVDGTQPTLTSTVLAISARATNFGGPLHVRALILGSVVTSNRLRLLWTFVSQSGTSTSVGYSGDNAFRMWVKDVGESIASTGIYATGSGGGGAKVRKDMTWTCNDVRSYRGPVASAGANTLLSSTRGYQGRYDGINGNTRSLFYFSAADQTAINDIIGIPGADIETIEAYFYFDHWYSIGGGQARYGFHNNTNKTDQTGASFSLAGFNWEGRDIGKWLTINPAGSTASALRAGTFKGFTLGPGVDDTQPYYGYTTVGAKLRVVYYK